MRNTSVTFSFLPLFSLRLLDRNSELSLRVDNHNRILDDIYDAEETRERLGIKGVDVLGKISVKILIFILHSWCEIYTLWKCNHFFFHF